MKLGILVVYFVSGDNDWVIEKQLNHFARTKPLMEFKIYAAANRLADRHRSLFQSYGFVEFVKLPTIAERGGAEHGTYLDMLATHALEDGCDYVSTFDVDSWPIDNDWIRICYERIKKDETPAAAIFREENGDTALLHPSFSFLEARLFHDPECRYWIPESKRTTGFRNFLSDKDQFGDTGASLAYFLESRGFSWTKLLRTNKENYHYLMGGIYGDIVFHVGASSRNNLIFRKDVATWTIHLTRPIASIPILWRTKPTLQNLLRSTYEPSIQRKNKNIFNTIADKLETDEEGFYRELRGEL